jgi:hypothetical protein
MHSGIWNREKNSNIYSWNDCRFSLRHQRRPRRRLRRGQVEKRRKGLLKQFTLDRLLPVRPRLPQNQVQKKRKTTMKRQTTSRQSPQNSLPTSQVRSKRAWPFCQSTQRLLNKSTRMRFLPRLFGWKWRGNQRRPGTVCIRV